MTRAIAILEGGQTNVPISLVESRKRGALLTEGRVAIQTIQIPVLTDSHLRAIEICGNVRTRKKSDLARLKQIGIPGLIADVGTTHSPLRVQLIGAYKVKGHLHVNILRSSNEIFSKPKPVPLAEIVDNLSRFIGKNVDVNVVGHFIVRQDELPPKGLILSSIKVKKHGGLKIAQSGQELTILEGPIDMIRWKIINDGEASVRISLHDRTEIEADYLEFCKIYVQHAFDNLILESD